MTRLAFYRRCWAGLVLLVLALATLTSCGGQEDVSIEDKREVQGDKVVESLRADNAKGTSILSQELPAKKQYNRQIKIDPNPGVKLDTAAVREKILTKYNLKDGNAEQVCVVPVEVPAGKIFEYDLEWSEVWREGTIETGSPDGNPEGYYRFLQSLTCQVVGQRVLN